MRKHDGDSLQVFSTDQQEKNQDKSVAAVVNPEIIDLTKLDMQLVNLREADFSKLD